MSESSVSLFWLKSTTFDVRRCAYLQVLHGRAEFFEELHALDFVASGTQVYEVSKVHHFRDVIQLVFVQIHSLQVNVGSQHRAQFLDFLLFQVEAGKGVRLAICVSVIKTYRKCARFETGLR